jgi:GcrA cell cycle regulator
MNSVHPVNTHPIGAPPINPGLAAVMTPRPEVSRPEHERAAADVTRSPAPPPRVQVAPRPYARSLTCCWPIGEPGTKSFRFCDDGAVGGKPYCAAHAAVAYVKVRDRREDAA